MLAFQNLPIDSAMFYDARLGASYYGGMFNPMNREPLPAYYGFKCFGELYRMGNQVETIADGDGIYAVAARSGEEGAVMIANVTENEVPLTIDCGKWYVKAVKLTAEGYNDADVEMTSVLPAQSFIFIKLDKCGEEN